MSEKTLDEEIMELIALRRPDALNISKDNAETCVQVGAVLGILLAWIRIKDNEKYPEALKSVVLHIDQIAQLTVQQAYDIAREDTPPTPH